VCPRRVGCGELEAHLRLPRRSSSRAHHIRFPHHHLPFRAILTPMKSPTGGSYGCGDGRVPAEATGRQRHIASGRRSESHEGVFPRELAAPPVLPRAPRRPPRSVARASSRLMHMSVVGVVHPRAHLRRGPTQSSWLTGTRTTREFSSRTLPYRGPRRGTAPHGGSGLDGAAGGATPSAGA